MNDHPYFEELCALAASGMASADEVQELERHLQGCATCRESFTDFSQVSAGLLSAGHGPKLHQPTGMTARFVERAIAEGIPLHQPLRYLPIWASVRRIAWAGTMAAALIIVFLAGRNPQIFTDSLSTQPNEAAIHRSISTTGHSRTSRSVSTSEADSMEEEVKRLQAALQATTVDLHTANAEKQELKRAVADLNDQINRATGHDADIANRLAKSQTQLDQLRQQAEGKDTQIADLVDQVKQHETKNTDQVAWAAANQIQVHSLKNQLAEREATIEGQRKLLAVGSQARDLIIARNLHIIDVHDNNGAGQRQKAFGRIFYTEGKQIIFYAYDLDSASRLKKQVAFYVWGGTLGDRQAVKNLGVFRNDDAEAGRWVLTFDDPHVLAEINTVFVTAESNKDVMHPDGKQILFAYLGDKANHP
jgi:peptidoglycan hydrolase CwlO-like protein